MKNKKAEYEQSMQQQVENIVYRDKFKVKKHYNSTNYLYFLGLQIPIIILLYRYFKDIHLYWYFKGIYSIYMCTSSYENIFLV